MKITRAYFFMISFIAMAIVLTAFPAQAEYHEPDCSTINQWSADIKMPRAFTQRLSGGGTAEDRRLRDRAANWDKAAVKNSGCERVNSWAGSAEALGKNHFRRGQVLFTDASTTAVFGAPASRWGADDRAAIHEIINACKRAARDPKVMLDLNLAVAYLGTYLK